MMPKTYFELMIILINNCINACEQELEILRNTEPVDQERVESRVKRIEELHVKMNDMVESQCFYSVTDTKPAFSGRL